MIRSWAEVTAERIESQPVQGAEMIGHPPGGGMHELEPGRTWAKCESPRPKMELG